MTPSGQNSLQDTGIFCFVFAFNLALLGYKLASRANEGTSPQVFRRA